MTVFHPLIISLSHFQVCFISLSNLTRITAAILIICWAKCTKWRDVEWCGIDLCVSSIEIICAQIWLSTMCAIISNIIGPWSTLMPLSRAAMQFWHTGDHILVTLLPENREWKNFQGFSSSFNLRFETCVGISWFQWSFYCAAENRHSSMM